MPDDLKGNQNLTAEIGLSKLSVGSVPLAEQIADAEMQRSISRTMSGVLHDQRGGNIHEQSMSMLPRRPTDLAPQPTSGRNGWAEPIPLSNPPGIDMIDRALPATDKEREGSKE